MVDEGFSNLFDLFDLYVTRDGYYREVEDSLQDPNATNDTGYTLLHAAACSRRRNTRIVKLLLSRGADVNAVTPLGYTPLHFAAASRGYDNVDVLIENRASLNAEDFMGRTALHYAIGEFLYQSPMLDFNTSCDMRIVQRILRESELCIDAKDIAGETPLMWAVNEGNLEAVRSLLKKGADPNIHSITNRFPLHRALCILDLNENIVFELIKAGADLYSVNNMGLTAVEILLLNARNDSSLEFASQCLSLIALRRQRNGYLDRQLSKTPELSQLYEKFCKEVNLMKNVIVHDKFNLHDFALNGFQCDDRQEINKTVVEILLSGLFPEYLETILLQISRRDLLDILNKSFNIEMQQELLDRVGLLNLIRCFYDDNVDLRRRLLNQIENLFSIFQKC